jgi:hypothetical protein
LLEDLRLQDRRAQHPEHAAVQERDEDPLGGQDLVGVPLERVDHEGDRYQEAAEQDDDRIRLGCRSRR